MKHLASKLILILTLCTGMYFSFNTELSPFKNRMPSNQKESKPKLFKDIFSRCFRAIKYVSSGVKRGFVISYFKNQNYDKQLLKKYKDMLYQLEAEGPHEQYFPFKLDGNRYVLLDNIEASDRESKMALVDFLLDNKRFGLDSLEELGNKSADLRKIFKEVDDLDFNALSGSSVRRIYRSILDASSLKELNRNERLAFSNLVRKTINGGLLQAMFSTYPHIPRSHLMDSFITNFRISTLVLLKSMVTNFLPVAQQVGRKVSYKLFIKNQLTDEVMINFMTKGMSAFDSQFKDKLKTYFKRDYQINLFVNTMVFVGAAWLTVDLFKYKTMTSGAENYSLLGNDLNSGLFREYAINYVNYLDQASMDSSDNKFSVNLSTEEEEYLKNLISQVIVKNESLEDQSSTNARISIDRPLLQIISDMNEYELDDLKKILAADLEKKYSIDLIEEKDDLLQEDIKRMMAYRAKDRKRRRFQDYHSSSTLHEYNHTSRFNSLLKMKWEKLLIQVDNKEDIEKMSDEEKEKREKEKKEIIEKIDKFLSILTEDESANLYANDQIKLILGDILERIASESKDPEVIKGNVSPAEIKYWALDKYTKPDPEKRVGFYYGVEIKHTKEHIKYVINLNLKEMVPQIIKDMEIVSKETKKAELERRQKEEADSANGEGNEDEGFFK